MNKSEASDTKKNLEDRAMSRVIAAIGEANETAAVERVSELQDAYPQATADALVGMLIKQKCLQSGAIGQITSSASIIPGVGVFVSLVFGEAADAAMTAKMQAELVLEIAAAYDRQLNPDDKQNALLLVTGMSDNVNSILTTSGQEIARQANRALAQQGHNAAAIQVTEAAGANILTTYVLGRRAASYFKSDRDAAGDWVKSELVIPKADAQTLAIWLSETTQRSWQLVSQSAQSATGIVLVAGQALGEVLPVRAASAKAMQGLSQGTKAVSDARGKAGRMTTGTGRGIAIGSEVVTDVVANTAGIVGEMAGEIIASTGQKAGRGLVKSAEKFGEIASNLLRGNKRSKKKRKAGVKYRSNSDR